VVLNDTINANQDESDAQERIAEAELDLGSSYYAVGQNELAIKMRQRARNRIGNFTLGDEEIYDAAPADGSQSKDIIKDPNMLQGLVFAESAVAHLYSIIDDKEMFEELTRRAKQRVQHDDL
jgi:hypothetical protein